MSENYDDFSRFNLTLLIAVTWMECIRLLRCYDQVRYLFRMIFMIANRTKWFLIVFIAYCVMIAFMFMALRGDNYTQFPDSWFAQYNLANGEYGDYADHYEKTLYVFSTIFLQLILANMLIALMG